MTRILTDKRYIGLRTGNTDYVPGKTIEWKTRVAGKDHVRMIDAEGVSCPAMRVNYPNPSRSRLTNASYLVSCRAFPAPIVRRMGQLVPPVVV